MTNTCFWPVRSAERQFVEHQFSINKLFIAAILQDNWRREYGNNQGLLRALQLLRKRKNCKWISLLQHTFRDRDVYWGRKLFVSACKSSVLFFSSMPGWWSLEYRLKESTFYRNRLYESRKFFVCYSYYWCHKGQREIDYCLETLSKLIHQKCMHI